MANHTHQPHTSLQQLMRGVSSGPSRVLSSVSEDSKVLKEIQASHAHDARDLDVTPVLSVIQDILQRAKLNDATNASEGDKDLVADVLAEKMGSVAAGPKGTMLEALAVTIQKICCEFSCKCTGGDVHASTMSVLNMVGAYSWDAKVVITLAAFAATYGELWLVILLSLANHPLAKSIAVLKQTPELSEISGVLKPQLTTVNELLTVVMDVARCLIEFRSLPSQYISVEDAPLATSMNQIATAAYWSVRSIVACGARITSNIGITSGLVTSATEAWDLSSLVHKQKSVHDQLRQKLVICYEFIEKKKKEEAYKNLELLFQSVHQIKDNVKIIKSLVYPKDDIAPLVRVTTRQRVHFDVLRGKTVLFFISDLDVSLEELATLDRIYKESRKHESELQYEILWLPVVDKKQTWTKEHEQRFKELQYKMSWYTLFHPSLLDEVAIRFIKEKFGFVKKQMLVSLDQTGKVVSQNALHMMLIWGNSAYPFTIAKEEQLWTKQTWKIEFLLDGIHPEVPKWLAQNVHICIFGGEDIEWIRTFTTSMKEHATKNGVKLELFYVGKHNAKEAVKKIITIISTEKLAHTVTDVSQVWYFWTRLESMLYSKMHHGKNVDNDNIVKEVMSVLSFDGGHQGWGCIGTANSTEMVKGNGQVILNAFSRYREWEEHSKKAGFLAAFLEHIRQYFHSGGHHCNLIELPSVEGAEAPSVVFCADCHRPMEKYYLYKCCTG